MGTKFFYRAALLAALSSALFACSQPIGGQNGGDFRVLNLEYRDENGNVTPASQVHQISSFRAVFSETVKADTLTNSNITLTKAGSNTPIRLAINGANFSNSASIASFNEVLQAGQQYTLSFSAGITSDSGKSLKDQSFTFQVIASNVYQGSYTRRDLVNVTNPTSIALLNDNVLLVAELDFGTTGGTKGSRIHKFNLSTSGNTVTASDGGIVARLDGQSVTGITTRNGNELWITHADLNPTYQPNMNVGPYSGAVMRCSGTNLGTCSDVITGLPRSYELHQTNGLYFKPGTNQLYIAQGGNTNYGAPSGSFGNQTEKLMGSSVVVADVNMIGGSVNVRPQSEGGTYPISNSNLVGMPTSTLPVRVYATGLRNPYDLVWTNSGKLFATDNGGNTNYGTTPSCGGQNPLDPGNSDDELNDIVQGGYYGHPNPARNQCIYNGGTNYQPATVKTGLNYGSDGVTEYTAASLPGTNVAQGDILYVNYANGDSLYRWRPSSPSTPPQLIVAKLVNPLDVVNDSKGTIFVVEFGSPFDQSQPARVSYLRPQ